MGLYASSGVLLTQATEPSNPGEGDLWYDTANDLLKGYDGSNYVQIGKTEFSNATVVTHSETIGDYSTPSAAVATSAAVTTADAVWGTSADQVIEDGSTYTDQTDFDASWVSSDTAKMRGNPTDNDIDLDFEEDSGTSNNNSIAYDLGAGNVSDTKFVLRGKINFSNLATDNDAYLFFSDSSQTVGTNTSQKGLGIFLRYGVSAKGFGGLDVNSAAPNSVNPPEDLTSYTFVTSTNYWFELIRVSATSYTIEFFSDSGFTTSLGKSTCTSASITGLRYLKCSNKQNTGNTGNATCIIDDLEFWNGVNSAGSPAANAFDDDTATNFKSNSEANPAIYVDCGSSKNILAVAIYGHADNTATEIKLRGSTDTSFTDSENMRTITVSGNLVAGQWNYFRVNLDIVRYIQVISTGTNVLSLAEIKYLTKTDSEILADLGILEISTSDTSLGNNGV